MLPLLEPAWDWTLDALFPPRCSACSRFSRARFCAQHAPTALPVAPPFCRVCASPFDPLAKHDEKCADCRNAIHSFEAARAAWLYAGAPREAIHRFKYGGKSALATRLAPALLDLLRSDEVLSQHFFDCVVAVPLHPRRERKRGFNQSDLLARALARQLDVPSLALLQRIRATPPQVGLDAKARSQNVLGAFALHPRAQATNQRILIVDDVYTTGSTLRECAAVLKKGGALSVCAVTIARQVSPDVRPLFEMPSVFEGLAF
jgi:competence protein ComFC